MVRLQCCLFFLMNLKKIAHFYPLNLPLSPIELLPIFYLEDPPARWGYMQVHPEKNISYCKLKNCNCTGCRHDQKLENVRYANRLFLHFNIN